MARYPHTDLFVGQKFRISESTEYDNPSMLESEKFGGKIVTLKGIVGQQPSDLAIYKCSFDEGQGLDKDLVGGVQWSFYRTELEEV